MEQPTTSPASEQPLDLRGLMVALGDRPVVVYPAYRRLVGGSWPAAVALAQIVYWWRAVGGRRFYKTDAELAEECGLSLKELETAKRHLRSVPGLRISREGMPARTHYDLDPEAFIRALAGSPVSQIVETSFPRTVETSFPRAHGTDQTEMTAEMNTTNTLLSGVSNGREPGGTEPREEKALEELARRRERRDRLDDLESAREAERRLNGVLQAAGGAEMVRLFRELTRPGLELGRWRRWIQHQIIPEVERLGADLAAAALRPALGAATGAREPRPYLVRVLRSVQAPRSAEGTPVEELDLDELLGPIEEVNDDA